MRFESSINKTGQMYIPQLVRENGFEGDVVCEAQQDCILVMRPGAEAEQVAKSVRVVLQTLLRDKDVKVS